MNRRVIDVVRVVLAAVILLVVVVPSAPANAAVTQIIPDDGPSAVIDGTGSWGVSALMTRIASATFNSPTAWDAKYVAKGDREARSAFAAGDKDFVVSGTPLTDDDRAALAGRGAEVIDAPFAVGSIAFVVGGPGGSPGVAGFLKTCVPKTVGAGLACTSYAGSPPGYLRMDNAQISQVFLVNGFNVWITDDFAKYMPDGVSTPERFTSPPSDDLRPVVRTDASSLNYYFEAFLKSTTPALYDSQLAAQGLPPGIQSEDWPLLLVPGRGGGDAVAGAITSGQAAAGSFTPAGGQIAPVAAADITAMIDEQAHLEPTRTPTQLFTVLVQNGAGQFVAPTTATLSKAAELGAGRPLFGLAASDLASLPDPAAASDVYPLTYLQRIYLPATGLTAEKANVLATLLRFDATSGQAIQATLGEGTLPTGLALETLDKAEELVTRNCVGVGRSLVTADDGGPYWPADAPPPTGLGFHLCRQAPSATATTIKPTTGAATTADPVSTGDSGPSNGSAATSGGGGAGSPSRSSRAEAYDAVVEAATANAPGGSAVSGGPASGGKAAAIVAELPLGLPDDGDRTGLSRFDAVVLGAVLFLLLRRPVTARLHRGTS